MDDDSLSFIYWLGTCQQTSLSLMTVDSIPISELGRTGCRFCSGTRCCFIYCSLRSDSFSSEVFIICICVYLSLINETSQSRHAPQVSQPTSKPGRPPCVYYNINFKSMPILFDGFLKTHRTIRFVLLYFANFSFDAKRGA